MATSRQCRSMIEGLAAQHAHMAPCALCWANAASCDGLCEDWYMACPPPLRRLVPHGPYMYVFQHLPHGAPACAASMSLMFVFSTARMDDHPALEVVPLPTYRMRPCVAPVDGWPCLQADIGITRAAVQVASLCLGLQLCSRGSL
jgi:hypothetical protein